MFFYTLGFAQSGFTENKGQFNSKVKFQADLGQFRVYLDNDGFTILLHDEKVWGQIAEDFHHYFHGEEDSSSADRVLGFQAIKYQFEGASWDRFLTESMQSTFYNYYLGNDPGRWATDVRRFEKVLFQNVYPNIDVEFIAADTRFKYNFILREGADIEDIQFSIEGADYVVNKNRITINTRFGPLDEVMPVSYWVSEDGEEPADVWYEKVDEKITLRKLRNKKSSTLVIDPELIFATYSGSSLDNFGFTATYDAQGNLYSGGIALEPTPFNPRSNGSYPVTAGAYDVSFNGGSFSGVEGNNSPCDIAISKYSSDGSQLIYSTYIGGMDNEYPHSLIVDSEGNLVLFGTTTSVDYPTTLSAYNRKFNLSGDTIAEFSDIIISKFNTDGSRLLGSTFFGGSKDDGLNKGYNATRDFYSDEFRGEVNIDTNNQIYIASCTYSTDAPNPSSISREATSGLDGLVFSMNPDLSELRWVNYISGESSDVLFSIDFSRDYSSIYATGATNSIGLPRANGGHASSLQGLTDGIITKFSFENAILEQLTYVGTASRDMIMGLHVDRNNRVNVVGQTYGNFPIDGSLYSDGNSGQFIARYNSALTERDLSTTFGSGAGRPDITINAFLVDECGKFFVSGWGGNIDDKGFSLSNRSLSNMPLTGDALRSNTDGSDFYIAVFEEDMNGLLFGSYIGGSRTGDHVDGGTSRFDERGIIYQSVCASCPSTGYYVSDFPTTPGAYSETNKSYRCSNASFKYAAINFNAPPNMNDTLYEVIATEELEFTYLITDPDLDTILVNFDMEDQYTGFFRQFPRFVRSVETLESEFVFKPSCGLIGDTVFIDVIASDIGCPNTEDSNGRIGIIVKPPPVLDPPEVLCLFFTSDDLVRLEWVALTQTEYFKQMYLHKVWPDGRDEVIGTFSSAGANTYLDKDVNNPRNNNYSYYLTVENICDNLGPKSYIISTQKESGSPVKSTYLRTVTVVGDSLKVVWNLSEEDDFLEYIVFKSERGKDNFLPYIFITEISDTVFYDQEVDVNNISYCYKVQVTDNCGNLSKLSNQGCSIVIRGEAINKEEETPRFKMDLNWDNYVDWQGGVQEYELLRSVDTGSLRPIVKVYSKYQYYRDSNLDFDWGGYWYSVIAHEGPGGLDATSRSNDIYLIQPPLVFVPNAVTSNGDNLNDSFVWSDVFVREFEMRVYNRWGEKVFESTDKNATWTGEYKDNDLAYSNVYFWIVTYKGWDNYRHTANGTVTILK